jgi:endonuclease YncB( thermonuclease family)
VTKFLLQFVLFLVSGLFFNAHAEVYHRQDEKGRHLYSDRPSPGAERLAIRPGFSYSLVKYVYDGDTVTLQGRERVRLLGINTPEVESSKRRGEPGGEAARRWLKKAVEGKKVRLETGVTPRDKYGRLLAHLFLDDGTHINMLLVEEGLAIANIHPPELKYTQSLLQAQQRAEQAGRGIWGDPYYKPKPITDLLHGKLRGWHRFRGTPKRIKRSRRYVRLLFSDRIDVRIPKANLPLFPDLASYLGRPLEVRGWPSRRKGHYSILVRHPSALVAVGASDQ